MGAKLSSADDTDYLEAFKKLFFCSLNFVKPNYRNVVYS